MGEANSEVAGKFLLPGLVDRTFNVAHLNEFKKEFSLYKSNLHDEFVEHSVDEFSQPLREYLENFFHGAAGFLQYDRALNAGTPLDEVYNKVQDLFDAETVELQLEERDDEEVEE